MRPSSFTRVDGNKMRKVTVKELNQPNYERTYHVSSGRVTLNAFEYHISFRSGAWMAVQAPIFEEGCSMVSQTAPVR